MENGERPSSSQNNCDKPYGIYKVFVKYASSKYKARKVIDIEILYF